jgi:hypothetical protein
MQDRKKRIKEFELTHFDIRLKNDRIIAFINMLTKYRYRFVSIYRRNGGDEKEKVQTNINYKIFNNLVLPLY